MWSYGRPNVMAIQLGDSYGRIRIDASGARAGIEEAKCALSGFGTHLGSIVDVAIGNSIAMGLNRLTAALGDTASEIVSLGTDFESQMAIMSTAADTSVLSLEQLHDMALMVGGDTDLIGVSATSAADSITGLYKAGLSATEIFGDYNGYLAGTAELGGALRAAIDLAAASELDMVQPSQLAAVTPATFGGELEAEAERAEFINALIQVILFVIAQSVYLFSQFVRRFDLCLCPREG
jgi:hypothetical protein